MIDQIKAGFEGKKTDVVHMTNVLFQLCVERGAIAGCQQDDSSVVLEFGDGSAESFPVHHAQGKFRMICARLCAISNDLNPELENIYLGACTLPYLHGVIRIECENTLKNHYFRLNYEEANNAMRLSATRGRLSLMTNVRSKEMRKDSIWNRDLTPFFWRWLGYPLALLLIWVGANALVTGEINYRGVLSKGFTGLLGGFSITALGCTMAIRRIDLGHEWRNHECVLAVVTAVSFISFVLMRLIKNI